MTAVNAAALSAAAAYRTASETISPGASFGAALSRAMDEAVEIGRSADRAATAALTGQGSVTEVVLAVGRAELALQTAVAVRDRLVSAYQEIMRMPI